MGSQCFFEATSSNVCPRCPSVRAQGRMQEGAGARPHRSLPLVAWNEKEIPSHRRENMPRRQARQLSSRLLPLRCPQRNRGAGRLSIS